MQGGCGSCAAFTTMSVIETCFKRVTGVFGDYSEQQLVDCAYGSYGANGCNGARSNAYAMWANTSQGFLSEDDHPYKNTNPTLVCPSSLSKYSIL